MKKISYDFSVNNYVSVNAPIGTDPESLTEQARNKLIEIIKNDKYEIEFNFETTFDAENGSYNKVWNK